MTIRPVKISELEILLSITRETFIHTYEHLNNPDDFQTYLNNNFTLEKIQKELDMVQNDPDVTTSEVQLQGVNSNLQGSYYYFAETEKIIGYFKINTDKSPLEGTEPIIYDKKFDFNTLKGVEIERIYVLPVMKGQGIGRLMIEKIIEIAKTNGFVYVWLGVWAENAAAITFYQKIGFTIFGEHTFMMGNDAQKDLMMMI